MDFSVRSMFDIDLSHIAVFAGESVASLPQNL